MSKSIRKLGIVFGVVTVAASVLVLADGRSWSAPQNSNEMTKLTITNEFEANGIRLLSDKDPEYSSDLTAFVGSARLPVADGLSRMASPMTLLVANDNDRGVVGIALKWTFVRETGAKDVFQVQSSPGILLGMKVRDPFLKGKTSLINPRSSRFLSYFQIVQMEITNMFNTEQFGRLKYDMSETEMDRIASGVADQRSRILAGVKEIVVSIDGVVFDDGTYLGRNESHLRETLQGAVASRRDLLRSLRNNRQTGKRDSQVLDDILSKIPKGLPISAADEMVRHDSDEAFSRSYNSHLQIFADEVRGKRQRVSDEKLMNDLLSVTENDLINIRDPK
jgi:hypothetical protein